jgi:hypothetical protein
MEEERREEKREESGERRRQRTAGTERQLINIALIDLLHF